ncbi:MAG: flavin reductase family protein [Ruminococcaceae bacterium]|nr:flavin reductase family protein [Oscillospiraceae bacterium]
MAKQNWKGSALLAPVPAVLVSCGNGEKDNLITIGWTGIVCTQPPKLYISVRPERFSYELIKQSKEFCVNLPTAEMARAVDWCGVRSGRDYDKFAEMKLTKADSFAVNCKSVAECPLTLECKVDSIVPLGSHDMFIADIVNVAVDESLLDENGRLMLEKANLLAYAHGDYFTLGKKIGDFGFSVRKKRNLKRYRK